MLELAWPWVFLLFPLPWVLRALLPAAPTQEAALRIHFIDELEALSGQKAQKIPSRWRQQLPLVGIWILLLLAAARPQQQGAPLPIPATGRDLMLAVDISGSMDTPDLLWHGETLTRLEGVQQLFSHFIDTRQGDRMGLILFGSQAYVQAPLTFDRHTVQRWLEEARIGFAGHNTALGEAIGLAIKRLRDSAPEGQRLLILVTDGANNSGSVDPRTAARLAAETGIKIHTIGIGTADVPSTSAQVDPLDEPLLRYIAEQTGGQYIHMTLGQENLQAVTQLLNQLEPVHREEVHRYATRPLYIWPLAIAALAVLFRMALRLWPPLHKRLIDPRTLNL